jgi:hypothetical protein
MWKCQRGDFRWPLLFPRICWPGHRAGSTSDWSLWKKPLCSLPRWGSGPPWPRLALTVPTILILSILSCRLWKVCCITQKIKRKYLRRKTPKQTVWDVNNETQSSSQWLLCLIFIRFRFRFCFCCFAGTLQTWCCLCLLHASHGKHKKSDRSTLCNV